MDTWRRTHHWGNLTRLELRDAAAAGALPILPAGSVEQHADHLPLDTDLLAADRIAHEAAARCVAAHALILPPLPFGLAPEHAAFPGTITLALTTLIALVADVAASVRRAGFDRLLIVNGHGGNQPALQAACAEHAADDFLIAATLYWTPAEPAWRPLLPGNKPGVGHACAYETAIRMALEPGAAPAIAARAAALPPRLNPPWLETDPAPLRAAGLALPHHYGPHDPGYYGDPAAATPEAGRRLLDATVAGLATLYAAFARARLTRD